MSNIRWLNEVFFALAQKSKKQDHLGRDLGFHMEQVMAKMPLRIQHTYTQQDFETVKRYEHRMGEKTDLDEDVEAVISEAIQYNKTYLSAPGLCVERALAGSTGQGLLKKLGLD